MQLKKFLMAILRGNKIAPMNQSNTEEMTVSKSSSKKSDSNSDSNGKSKVNSDSSKSGSDSDDVSIVLSRGSLSIIAKPGLGTTQQRNSIRSSSVVIETHKEIPRRLRSGSFESSDYLQAIPATVPKPESDEKDEVVIIDSDLTIQDVPTSEQTSEITNELEKNRPISILKGSSTEDGKDDEEVNYAAQIYNGDHDDMLINAFRCYHFDLRQLTSGVSYDHYNSIFHRIGAFIGLPYNDDAVAYMIYRNLMFNRHDVRNKIDNCDCKHKYSRNFAKVVDITELEVGDPVFNIPVTKVNIFNPILYRRAYGIK